MKQKDTHGESGRSWIGVDLDGTLAEYDGWKGAAHIGKPIPKMVERVIKWMTAMNGPSVKIMTARVWPGHPDVDKRRRYIELWLEEHVYSELPPIMREISRIVPLEITHEKDPMMIELWDDRCVSVIPNTGERTDEINALISRREGLEPYDNIFNKLVEHVIEQGMRVSFFSWVITGRLEYKAQLIKRTLKHGETYVEGRGSSPYNALQNALGKVIYQKQKGNE